MTEIQQSWKLIQIISDYIKKTSLILVSSIQSKKHWDEQPVAKIEPVIFRGSFPTVRKLIFLSQK